MSIVETRKNRIKWIQNNIKDFDKIDPLFDRVGMARVRDRLLVSGVYPPNQRWIDDTSLTSLVLAAQGKPTRRSK